MKPSFSTVILFFDKPKLTTACLESVRVASEAATKTSIYLIDNGSRDSARAINEKEMSSLNLDTHLVKLTPNRGFSGGMNAGLTRAFGDNPETTHVVTLSNDIRVAPDFFEQLSRSTTTALAHSPTDTPILYCPQTYHWYDTTRLAYTHGELDVETMELRHEINHDKTRITFPEYYPAAALVWSRAAFEKLKGFDEDFFCYWEDVDLSRRALKQGVELQLAHELRVFHLGRGTTKGKSRYVEYFADGREKMQRRITSQSTAKYVKSKTRSE